MSTETHLHEAHAAIARHDWETARESLRAAARLGTDDLSALATACWWLGLADEHVQANAEVHRRRQREGSPALAGMAALEIGYCEFLRGNESAGAGWLAKARREFGSVPDTPEAHYLLAIDAETALAGDHIAGADQMAARVVSAGEQHDDPTLLALGLFLRGLLAVRDGRLADADGWLDEAMLPVREGHVTAEWAGNLYCRMMQLCHELGDLPRARAWTELTEEWCRGYLPATVFAGICRVHRVQILQVEGRWDRAEEEARSAADELVALDLVPAAEAHYRLGEIHRLRGNLDAAESSYDHAHELGRDPLPGVALLRLLRGHGHVAASILEAALAAESHPLTRAPLLAARAEVALAAEDLGAANRSCRELDRIADTFRSPGWRAEAQHWAGALAVARSSPAAGLVTLRNARRCWQHIGAPYEVARVRVHIAQAQDLLDDHDSAARERCAAAATFEQLGARIDLEQVRLHTRSGRRPGGLSPREVEVLAAISAGGTNREAADRLHISERTVARHLANVYAKTGVSTRTGAVTWARERGLL